ncbi:hypothetical protein AKJ09_09468 [Labilithrix luteola]|uniref:Lipoprotein n=1 Tax=Labilithrix luteola TaxID=1391654 RepID=A0A0K1QBM1_9BACT|nr:HmuY family protein [Labilithrix luteola]AKV02805.1 hypothetical protein AKJ09_09468 [Labilithrix luteola]
MRWFSLALIASIAAAACSDSAGSSSHDGTTLPTEGGATKDAGNTDETFASGTELRVTVPASGRVYVNLASASVVDVAGDPLAQSNWDLAFDGLDVFTNSGPSGNGAGGSFGPLDAITFVSETAPTVPFIAADKAGGAFLDWYAYDGTAHALWSRYHVYGVKDGDHLFKVQVLGYYGEREGAPVSGIYAIRYAELGAASGETKALSDLDGTAGGTSAPAGATSECLDLVNGARTLLTPAEAATSSAWSLCFRRASISVDGEKAGPRGVLAVDLQAADTAHETVEAMKTKTADSETARFDAVNGASFEGKTFRGDRIVSGFGEAWIDATKSPLVPAAGTWLAVDASGKQKYVLGFRAFENPTTTSPGTVVMRIKPVKG